ncbi:alpha-amylase family protein [Mycolicibacterium fortuitum]|uniref:Alpha-amylase family protein n=2 Tax=Mycolicibacterium fortuitum TaxID=1766 RepID=A0AAE4VA49_MYCFO|nr:alpha-amylase family protein [Mycolicibacterium fortuitum]MCA4725968.1 alpha-amylase family protein [Mycolicibacterium fortuitum]MCV7139131.1 alpha-amylase family protein [Mycolicibacterium fortuitum]MDV7190762.1 alpha-amylase family protein [Mycolicibacterium fortuitum]MDV7203871.1 alpha-amylase family protein [Mycolicibacterium fortuitum]MDV7225192.1 alpha-amylase family protein [Mycolicibacterium fortuitum]
MPEPGWVAHAIWWQIYPLGFVGAFPADQPPSADEHRLRRIVGWLDHAVQLGASGLALGPIFASRTHGYDTTDHFRIDPRLGDDDDFDHLVSEARRRGLRILLDGVFNHVGTDFARYRDGDTSWFHQRPNGFGTFEGHGELITLNHANPEVVAYTADVMAHWLRRGADGWRLDAAYAVPDRFWAQVLPSVRQEFPEAWFVGEVIHGDYSGTVSASTFDSVTQYELWKAIWSSLNDGNFHELDWALKRHNEFLETFVPLTFVGNHDVTRIASQLENSAHLEHALVLLLTTGGTPSIYAGDESAYRGVKEERRGGDDAVRPEFTDAPEDSDSLRLHQYLIGLRRRHPWLHTAKTFPLLLTNTRYVYRTIAGSESLIVALNIDDAPLSLAPADLELASGRVIAGSGAPPQDDITHAEVPPHGWLIIQPH